MWNFHKNQRWTFATSRCWPNHNMTRPVKNEPNGTGLACYLPVTEDRLTGDVRVELWPVPVTHREPHPKLEHLQSSFILTAASHQSCRGCGCDTCYTCKQFTCYILYTVYLLHVPFTCYAYSLLVFAYNLPVNSVILFTCYAYKQFTCYAFKQFTCYAYSLPVIRKVYLLHAEFTS